MFKIESKKNVVQHKKINWDGVAFCVDKIITQFRKKDIYIKRIYSSSV